jgi:crossover junction endodeoxyribonuclease RuvC
MIEQSSPAAASIEGVFHFRNPRTAVILGQARGAAMVACIQGGLPLYEYAPRRVKQAVCGSGSAPKEQVARMVAAILHLSRPLPEDESDAAALAICHLHHQTTVAGLGPAPL